MDLNMLAWFGRKPYSVVKEEILSQSLKITPTPNLSMIHCKEKHCSFFEDLGKSKCRLADWVKLIMTL